MFWILPLIIIAVYARSLSIYFSGDDWVFLYGALRGLDLPYIFRFIPGSFAPLINFSFLIFYKLFQLNEIYYHLAVLSLHAVNCILFFYIIQTMSHNKKLASLAAILFSVFSPYTQIVIWIDGLPGLITSLFFLSSFYSFILYRNTKRYTYYFISLSSFILALLCKEWAITVFALFIFYDIFFYKAPKQSLLKPMKSYIPFILILTIYLSAELSLPYSEKKDMIGLHFFSNLSTYLTTFIIPSQNINQFPAKALIPFLNIFLPPLVKTFSILIPILSLAAIIWGPAFIKFYTLWCYITLFPFLFFPWGTASRYYYIPSMSFIAVLSYLSLQLIESFKNRACKNIISICLCLFIILHIFFVEVRISKLYHKNEKDRSILEELQVMYPDFPEHSRLFFSGFLYSRKWGYAIRTIYRDPTLITYRRFPTPQEMEEKSFPVFIFDYKNEKLQEIPFPKNL